MGARKELKGDHLFGNDREDKLCLELQIRAQLYFSQVVQIHLFFMHAWQQPPGWAPFKAPENCFLRRKRDSNLAVETWEKHIWNDRQQEAEDFSITFKNYCVCGSDRTKLRFKLFSYFVLRASYAICPGLITFLSKYTPIYSSKQHAN